jgi:hypothetical protein
MDFSSGGGRGLGARPSPPRSTSAVALSRPLFTRLSLSLLRSSANKKTTTQQHQTMRPLSSSPAVLALLLVLILASAGSSRGAAIAAAAPPTTSTTTTPQQSGPPLGPSVILLGAYDWEITPGSDGLPWQRCADSVRRAATASRSSAIQFVPTLGFVLSSTSISSFCMFVSGVPNQPSPCQPLTPVNLADFKRGMEHCFLTALESGARTLAVRPHLDSGDGTGAWRNGLLLDPSRAYDGQYSYVDAMINPLADALASAQARWAPQAAAMMQPSLPQIDLALQGEMSATVVRYPGQWQALIEPTRKRASSSSTTTPDNKNNNVRIGVGMNFNRLDDLSSMGQTHDSSRLSWAAWALGITDVFGAGSKHAEGTVPKVDGPALGALLRSVDFVSISAYAPLSWPGFNPDELGNSAFMVVEQLEALGVPGAADSLFKPFGPTELVYGEVGLGGGNSFKGTTRATSPSEVALRPFFGVYGDHSSDSTLDPWAIPENSAFRREFFGKLSAWLEQGSKNKRFDVGGAYLWSKSSWDVLGVYDAGYHDPAIAEMLQRHNCLVGTAAWGDCGGGGDGAGEEEDEGVVTVMSRQEDKPVFVNRVVVP